jgi:hypothetical protein
MLSNRPKNCGDSREGAARAVTNEDPKSKTMRNDFFILGLVTVNLLACSSEGDILPKKERFARSDAALADDAAPDVAGDGRKPRDPNANCVKPGTPNNERGIGGYCEPGRGDCESEQGPRFCTADYAELTPIDDDKWFCSTVCVTDEECGTGTLCSQGAIGKGCAPFACVADASTQDR